MTSRPTICLALVAALLCARAWGAPNDARPNILLAIADDWGWPHAGAYGDPVVKTPAFDRVARQGVLFRQAHVAAPTCTASRGGLLTGQAIHRLEEGGNLWSALPGKFEVYPDLLEQAGYAIGCTRKGWGPGTLEGTGRTRNPAGPNFKNFAEFFEQVPAGKPFCFWFGSTDPHRPYEPGSGRAQGLDPARVKVPAFLPDTTAVRHDLLDYYAEVQRFDRDLGEMLRLLEQSGRLENTLVVVTGDNGIPFPRAKATCYDAGSHVPLAIAWPARVPAGRTVDDLVSLTDLAPTFLEAAGLASRPAMTGRSLLGVLLSGKSGRLDAQRRFVVVQRERHGYCRQGGKSYPVRALRTADFLYLRNFRPELWPAGDPEYIQPPSIGTYGDVDGSPTKSEILDHRDAADFARYFRRSFAKRPAEELYDLRRDPEELENVAGQAAYAGTLEDLRGELDRWMRATADPRAQGETDFWDTCPYVRGTKQAKRK